MNKIVPIKLLTFLLVFASGNVFSQDINIYISKQFGNYTKFTGSYSKTTDKFERGSVTPSISGPITITVNPTDLSIDTNQSKTWTGSLYPNMAQAPEPGSSADASLSGAYSVRFKKDGEIVTRDSTIVRTFKVHTLKVTAPDTLLVLSGGKTTISAEGYPAGGAYEWRSTTGVTIENGNTASPTIKITATSAPSDVWVQYSFDTIRVTKRIILQGFNVVTKLLTSEGNTLSKPLCDGQSGAVELKIVPPQLTERVKAALTVTPTIRVKEGETNNGNVIGHTNLPIQAQNGESLKWDFGPAFWYSNVPKHCNNVSYYEIVFTNQMVGLPSGISIPNKDLRVSASFNGCINGHANFNLSIPNLNFSPPLNFVPDPTNPNIMRVVATQGDYPTMVITSTVDRNGRFAGYKYQFEIGNFKFSEVEIGITTPESSQFYDLTVAEENFHKGQFKGENTSIALLNNLPTAQKIVTAVNNDLAGYRNNNLNTGALVASNRFRTKIIAGVNLFNAMLQFGHANGLRCALEAEAKAALEATNGNIFKAAMPCAYPNCK